MESAAVPGEAVLADAGVLTGAGPLMRFFEQAAADAGSECLAVLPVEGRTLIAPDAARPLFRLMTSRGLDGEGAVPGGGIVAFETPEQELALYDTTAQMVTTTSYVLESGTSPAVAASAHGGWQAAIVGTDDRLDLIDSATSETETSLPVYAGVSPTITAPYTAEAYEAAYETPTSYFGLAGTEGGLRHHVRLKPATHPTITLIP
jgi:hypothetical protein